MLLGEYEQRLDDKNRLTMPARLREQFADGVVCARGLDGCIHVWPREGWDAYVSAQGERLDSFTREGRAMQRYLFGGARQGEPDRQGRIALPAHADRARADSQGDRGRAASATDSRSGTARPGAASSPRSKGVPRVVAERLAQPRA